MAIVNGQADVMSAYITNQPFILQQKGIPFNILDPAASGVDFYGDCLITSVKLSEQSPELVEAFKAASLRGWDYALQHPEEIIDLILRKYNTSNKSREALRYEATETAKLILPERHPLGSIDPERVRRIANAIIEAGIGTGITDIESFIFGLESKPTNEDTATGDSKLLIKLLIQISLIFIVVIIVVFSLLRFLSKTSKKSAEFTFQKKRYLIVTFIALFLTFTVSITWVALNEVKRDSLNHTQESLQAVLNSTNGTIEIWLNHNIEQLEYVASDPTFIAFTEKLLRDPTDKASLSKNSTLHKLREYIKTAHELNENTGFFIINPDYISIGSMRNTNLGTINLIYDQRPELLKEVFTGKSNFIPPVYTDLSADKNKSTMFYAVPIRDNVGKVIAVLTLREEPQDVFTGLCQLGRVGKTGESYAIDASGTFISSSRFEDQIRELNLLDEEEVSLLNLVARDPGGNLLEGFQSSISRNEQPLTFMARNVTKKLDELEIQSYRDYRGVEVFGIWQWNESLNFGLAVEIDREDALSSYYLTRTIIVIILIIVALLAIGSTIISILIGEKANKALQNYSKELEDHKEHLEDEVEKRTADLVQREAEITEQKEMLSTTIESLAHPFYVIDTNDYSVILANKAAKDLAKNGTITTCHTLSHKTDTPCDSVNDPCPLKEIRTTGKPAIMEHTHFDQDGNPFYVEVHGYPVFNDDGELIQMIEYSLDITERKLVEAQIKESKNRTEAILKASTNGIITINGNGIIETFNPAAEQIFGYTAEEIIGQNVKLLTPDEHRANHDNYLKNYLTTGIQKMIGKRVETEAVRKSGKHFPIEIGINEVVLKDSKLFTAIVNDITERKKAEEAVRRLSVAVEQSPSSIVITNMDGSIEYVNPKFSEVTGYTQKEALGNNPRVLNSGEHPKSFFRELWKTISSGKEWHGEICNRKKNGDLYWESASISPLINDEGNITHFVAVKEDITEKRAADEKIKAVMEQLEYILDTGPVGVAFSTKGIIHFANPRFEEMFGVKPGDKSPQLYVDPKERDKLVKMLTDGDKIENYEIKMYDKNKRERDMLITYLTINYYGEEGILGWIMDISDRKKMEKNIRHINFMSDNALDLTKAGFWHIDLADQEYYTSSERAAAIFGDPPSEGHRYKLMEHWGECVKAGNAEAAEITFQNYADAVAGKVPRYDAIYAYKRPVDGEIVWIHAIGDVVRNADGKATDMFGVTQDITDQILAENDLKQKLDELERFNRLVTGREIRMIDLKKEVNELLTKSGAGGKYKIVSIEDTDNIQNHK